MTTKRPSEITTPRDLRINFDDNPLVIPVVLTCVTLTELLLPFIVYYCAKCKKKYKEWREKREDRARLQEVSRELERGLQQVARAGNQEERNRGVQDYQRTVKEYQSESEEKELRRKRGLYRNVSLLRLISMHSFFSFYLWLMYLGGCEISQCTQYGRIFFSLKIFGMHGCAMHRVYNHLRRKHLLTRAELLTKHHARRDSLGLHTENARSRTSY